MKTSLLALSSFLFVFLVISHGAKGDFGKQERDHGFDHDEDRSVSNQGDGWRSNYNDEDRISQENDGRRNDDRNEDHKSNNGEDGWKTYNNDEQRPRSYESDFENESNSREKTSEETSTAKPNIFVYLPYRPRTSTSRPLTSNTTTPSLTRWIPKDSVSNIRNWTPSPSKDLINRSSNVSLDTGKSSQQSLYKQPTLDTSSSRKYASVKATVRAPPVQRANNLVSSQSAVSYVQQSPVQYVSNHPQQVLVQDQPRSVVTQDVQAPPPLVQALPTIVQQSPLLVQNPPVQHDVEYAPPPLPPAQLVQSPPIHYAQLVPPPPQLQIVQSPPVNVVQAPPVHVLRVPSTPPCPPLLLSAPPALLQAPPPPRPFFFAPPPSPVVLFSPPRPVRTRTVYTQFENVPIQTHIQTSTHYSPTTRTIVYDSLGSNPRPVFAPRPKIFVSPSNMMPSLIMPPPPPSKLSTKSPKSQSKQSPSIDGSVGGGILGPGGIVSSLGERVLGALAEKFFEHEEKTKKKKLKYRGRKLMLKALIKRRT